MNDLRYDTIKARLCSLSKDELQRVIDNVDTLCVDTYNYDERSKKYCVLAIAMNLHELIDSPTDLLIKNEIAKRFTPVNVIKGVEGSFFRENRKDDILKISKEILENELYSSRC